MLALPVLRRVATAMSLVIVLAAPATAIDPPPDKQKWTRVRLDGYEVFTDLGDRKAIELGVAVQRMTDALAKALGAQRQTPVRVFVFAKPAEFRLYRDALIGPGTDKAGVCAPAADVTFIIVDGSTASLMAILNHELTHALFANKTFPAPLWIEEGLAGFYETVEVRSNGVRIGLANSSHVRTLRTAQALPTSEMLRITGAADDFQKGPEARRIYAQAWAMVHLMIVGGVTPPRAIADILRDIANDDPAEDAFTRNVGMSVEEFDTVLRNYVRQPTFRFLELPLERERATPLRAEKLEHGRLLAELAELLVRSRRHEDAAPFIERSLAADPNDARAYSARGYRHLEKGDFDEARVAFAKAQELDPSDEAIATAVKRLEPQVHFISGPGSEERPDTSKAPSRNEMIETAMREATAEERERLSDMVERSNKRAEAVKRYEQAIALANQQKIDESLKLLEALSGDPEVEQSLRDAAAGIRADILKQTGRQK